jgi:hypothetical protein
VFFPCCDIPAYSPIQNNRPCFCFIYFVYNFKVFVYIIKSSSSSSSSCSNQGFGPLVDSFLSHTSRSLFNGLPWFPSPFGV